MKFTLEVGDKQRSRIEFFRSAWTGRLCILADGCVVAQQSPYLLSTHFSFANVWQYEFSIGRGERHKVVIEHERPPLLACFRPHTYRVFVDSRLVHEQNGY
jgi:hypothetical protein